MQDIISATVRTATYRDIGFVYVIEDAASGRVKIGMSRKPERRIKSVMGSAGIADGRTYTSIRVKNAKALESSAHLAFAGRRLHGEFFWCSFDDAVAFVSAAAESDAADDGYAGAKLTEQNARAQAASDFLRRSLPFAATSAENRISDEKVTPIPRQGNPVQPGSTAITYHATDDDFDGVAVGSVSYDRLSGLHEVSISPGFRVTAFMIEDGEVLAAYADLDQAKHNPALTAEVLRLEA